MSNKVFEGGGVLGRDVAGFSEMVRVPAVYPTSAFLAVSAVIAFCGINKLRRPNPVSGFDSHPRLQHFLIAT